MQKPPCARCLLYHLKTSQIPESLSSGYLSGNTAEVPLQIRLLLCLRVCFPCLFHHSSAASQHVYFKALTGALGYRRLQLHQLLQSLIEALWCEFVLLPESDREMKTTWLRSPAPLYRGISGINSVWGCARALTLKMAPPGVIIPILLQWMIIKANSIALSQAPALLGERERKNYRENKAAIWVNC